MTHSVQTSEHLKAVFRKRQMLTIVCALFTIATALLATLSGLQLRQLRHAQEQQARNETQAAMTAQAVDPARMALEKDLDTAGRALADAQRQLATERENVRRLMERITGLERQLAVATAKALQQTESTQPPKAPRAPQQPAPQPEPAPPATAPAPQPESPPAATPDPETQPPVETAPQPAAPSEDAPADQPSESQDADTPPQSSAPSPAPGVSGDPPTSATNAAPTVASESHTSTQGQGSEEGGIVETPLAPAPLAQ